jgi:nucleotide-binding universal stress UspA family protein
MKVLTLYDGSLHAKTALTYSYYKANQCDGELMVLLVFQNSLYLDYDGGLMAQRAARADMEKYIQEVGAFLKSQEPGTRVRMITVNGEPEQELLQTARSEKADLVVVPERYRAVGASSPCPVSMVPGFVLVPVDSTNMLLSKTDDIIAEAKKTGAKVLVLGVIPIHLYGMKETDELEQVKNETLLSIKNMKKIISAQGVETSELMRSGYPYEEILKVADEYSASVIMLPSGGMSLSELTKAAAILLDEPSRLKRPIHLLEAAETI